MILEVIWRKSAEPSRVRRGQSAGQGLRGTWSGAGRRLTLGGRQGSNSTGLKYIWLGNEIQIKEEGLALTQREREERGQGPFYPTPITLPSWSLQGIATGLGHPQEPSLQTTDLTVKNSGPGVSSGDLVYKVSPSCDLLGGLGRGLEGAGQGQYC